MKKYLLKTWLLSIMMVFGVGSAWAADPDLENDYTLVKSVTWGDGVNIAGSGTCAHTAYDTGNKKQQSLTILTAPEDAAGWIAMQGWTDGSGKGWWNRADNSLYCVNGGRSACVFGDDLTTGWLVVFECKNTASSAITLTNANGDPDGTFSYAASEDGKTYFCTITASENAYVGFCGNKNAQGITKISVYKPNKAVIATTYTVKYVDMDGNTLKADATYDAIVGASVSLSDADKANITVEGTTYIYDSDDSADKTVAEEGATVITVKFHAAANYNYTVNEVCGETIARTTNATSYETANVKLGYRKYNAVEGQLYTKGATSKEYNYSFKLTQDNQVENISYAAVEGTTNVVFCAEGEDIEGLTPITEGNTTIRSSNSASAYAPADTKITTLPAGKYKIHAVIYDSASSPNSNWTFMAGPVEAAKFNCTTVNIAEYDSEEFAIGRETDIIMAKAGSTARGLDAIYIVKTGDLTADEVALLNAKDDLQEEINVAKALANGKEGVDALNTAISDAEAALAAAEATVESLGTALTTLATAVADFVKTTPILTFTGTVGEEASLTFGVYDTEDTFYVDFGNGTLVEKKVGVNNAGPVDPETGQTTGATVFTGTVGSEGIIKVYGINDVWYLVSSGAMPTTLDQSKLMNVVQMTITGVNAESVTLPEYTKMTQFSFNNSPVKTVDVSKVASLTNLGIVYSSLYDGEMNLEGIDLQSNTELTDLSIQSQKTGVNAKLKEIDLSKNTKLVNIYLPNNSLTNVILPSEFTKKDANDETALAKVSMFLNGNKLTAIDGLDKLPAKSTVNISNNLFTLATLPVKPANVSTSKYTYAPQPAYEVPSLVLVNDVVDLSSQLTATGILTEPATTSFSFVTGGETPTTLVEGTDYEVTEPGKFKFIKAQTEKVYGVMATDAFPRFTGANAFKTTEFAVMVPEDITIDASDITEGDITAAIATKTEGKLVKNITINLAAETAYKVTATIEVPAGLTINGNGATIDGSALTTPMIQMSTTPTVAQNEKEAYLSDGIVVKDVKVTGLKYQFIYGNKMKYLLAKVEVDNSVIAIDGTAKKTVFDFNGGGNASEIIINKSTIYANPSNEQNGGLFSSQSGHGSIQDLGSDKQLFAITNSTIYNIAYGKTTSSQRRNNTAGMEFKVENSVIVNSGKSGQFIVGLNGGSANSVQTYTASGNIFNFDEVDVSAAEQAKVQEKITTFEMTSYAGVVKFTNAAEGDFNGVFVVEAITPDVTFGDPRWTITQKVEPVDVAIAAEDITEGYITDAIAAKAAGKPVNNLVITLAANTAYKVTASMEVSGNVTITGAEGAVIDASALTTPFIQMNEIAADATLNEKGAYLIDGIIIKDVTITGLPYQLIFGNKQKYLMSKISVENSVIGINGTAKKTIFDFNGGGNASEIIINKSTIYANPSNEQNGGLFSSQSGHGSIQDLGSDKQLFAITNSTIYNIAYGKTTSSQRRNNTAGMEYKVENSVIVNSGKNGQFIVGLNGGGANAVQTYTASGNIFNFDGADVSANEQAKVQEKIAEFNANSIAGVVTFTDAANGNFNAQLAVALALASETVAVGDPRWTITAKQVPTAVVINDEDITEDDIDAAVAAKTTAMTTAGYLIGNITINLNAEKNYIVDAAIEVPAGLTINGNGATIDASALTTPMIQMSATQTGDKNEKEAYLSDGIIVKNVTVTGLKYQFIYGNTVKALLAKVEVENSVIGIDGTNKKTVFDFNGGGNASEIIINKSTIYANPSNEQNGGLFSSQSGHGSIQDLGSDKQLFAITNSTIYNIAYGKTTSSQRRNNTAGMEFKVENSVIVNSGKSGQFIVGLNGGSANAVQTYTASGNIFNFDGADVSANEQAKVQEKIAEFNANSIAGVVTFTDAANGNFAGNVEMPFGATEPTTKPGDPRWTLTYTNAPQKYAITVAETTNGTAVADKKEAAADEKVTITVTPAAGFELDAITVTGVTATAVEGQEGKYEFTMPAEAVTVTVTFKQATGIQSVKAADLNDAVIYNLNGARVSKAGKGLYIINGKKVVIK